MNAVACPRCLSKHTVWLAASSKGAYVDYYRCEACAHVWNVPKPPRLVTPTRPVDVSCPRCRANRTECLTERSEASDVDFLRCEACDYIWTIPRPIAEPPCDYDPHPA